MDKTTATYARPKINGRAPEALLLLVIEAPSDKRDPGVVEISDITLDVMESFGFQIADVAMMGDKETGRVFDSYMFEAWERRYDLPQEGYEPFFIEKVKAELEKVCGIKASAIYNGNPAGNLTTPIHFVNGEWVERRVLN